MISLALFCLNEKTNGGISLVEKMTYTDDMFTQSGNYIY